VAARHYTATESNRSPGGASRCASILSPNALPSTVVSELGEPVLPSDVLEDTSLSTGLHSPPTFSA
jgi:hypothetical protein